MEQYIRSNYNQFLTWFLDLREGRGGNALEQLILYCLEELAMHHEPYGVASKDKVMSKQG